MLGLGDLYLSFETIDSRLQVCNLPTSQTLFILDLLVVSIEVGEFGVKLLDSLDS